MRPHFIIQFLDVPWHKPSSWVSSPVYFPNYHPMVKSTPSICFFVIFRLNLYIDAILLMVQPIFLSVFNFGGATLSLTTIFCGHVRYRQISGCVAATCSISLICVDILTYSFCFSKNCRNMQKLPSGKRLQNNGKSPFSMGNSTINGHFQ